MDQKLKDLNHLFVELMEMALSVLIVIGLIVYACASVAALAAMDWHLSATFEEFVQRALFAMIGIELLQIIRIHALKDIFLISILLLVRKALMPGSSATEMIALTVSAVIILISWQILSRTSSSKNNPVA